MFQKAKIQKTIYEYCLFCNQFDFLALFWEFKFHDFSVEFFGSVP